MAHRHLASLSGVTRARLARDYYSYLHLPMIAGVVLLALGLKKAIEHVGDSLATVPAVALCGGAALYFFSHVLLRIRSVRMIRLTTGEGPGWFGVGRPAATVALAALIPVALELPALVALAAVTVVCCAVIVYDVVHYRDERREIRDSRP
jgi:low temperature requirement protein LtrA